MPGLVSQAANCPTCICHSPLGLELPHSYPLREQPGFCGLLMRLVIRICLWETQSWGWGLRVPACPLERCVQILCELPYYWPGLLLTHSCVCYQRHACSEEDSSLSGDTVMFRTDECLSTHDPYSLVGRKQTHCLS